MKIGYNTNGFTNHSLLSAIDIIGLLGFQSIAITIDHHALNPWHKDIDNEILEVKQKLEKYNLKCVIETGARFLLDPWQKHKPDLLSKEPKKRFLRQEFLKKSIQIAAMLDADVVSFWSGRIEDGDTNEDAWKRLALGCRQLASFAHESGLLLGFEPEPGMFIENLDEYSRLRDMVDHDNFKLTLDLGHAFITEKSVGRAIFMFKDDIVNIHIEDMKKKLHEHLFFGQGEMDFPEIFKSLHAIGYKGPLNIELGRSCHDAVNVASKAFDFLASFILPQN